MIQAVRKIWKGRVVKEKYTWCAVKERHGHKGTAFMVERKFREKVMELKKISRRLPYMGIIIEVANMF